VHSLLLQTFLTFQVRPGSIKEVKEIASTAGSLVLSNKGVLRGITNWGVFHLPRPISIKGGTKHHIGHYFVMRFDSSSKTQHEIRKTLKLEPRLLRFSVVKLAERLEDMADIGGEAEEWAGYLGHRGEGVSDRIWPDTESEAKKETKMGDIGTEEAGATTKHGEAKTAARV